VAQTPSAASDGSTEVPNVLQGGTTALDIVYPRAMTALAADRMRKSITLS